MPTGIYEIHAVPSNELPDRGREISQERIYIPYNTLTTGEMKLALLLEQANMYARAYPENKEYGLAANMLYQALSKGVSAGVNFVGALYNPVLQQVANEISKASRQTKSASKAGLFGRTSLTEGVKGIGEVEFKFNFDHDCVQYATAATNRDLKENKSWQWYEHNLNDSMLRRYYREQKGLCKVRIDIEKIVNDRITNASHHVLYHALDEAYPAIKNTTVVTKLLLQLGGVAGLANATQTDSSLMSIWSETSIMRKNSLAGVGTIGSVPSSFYLSPDQGAFNASYDKWKSTKVYDNPKKDKIGSVAAVTALVTAIAAAVKAAADFQRSLNEKKAGAMGSALNYGTPALQSKDTDFGGITSTDSNNNTLLIGGAALAAYFILND
jgi:hypothetical protein